MSLFVDDSPQQVVSTQTHCVAVVPKQRSANGHKPVVFPLYWIQHSGTPEALREVLQEVVSDPLLDELWYATPDKRSEWVSKFRREEFVYFAEKQFLPGVTDNLGKTVAEAISLAGFAGTVSVASGLGLLYRKSDLKDGAAIEKACRYHYYHPLTEKFVVHKLDSTDKQYFLSFPEVNVPSPPAVEVISLDLPGDDLEKLSQQRILALSKAEMVALREHFSASSVSEKRYQKGLPKWPTDVELEIIAQTWSEHCKHKIFNAEIDYRDDSRQQKIVGLYKTYIQATTKRLQRDRRDLLSVFEDNAGVVQWDDDWAVCFKVETHNSPSALEPYGGALTGILGVNRDILGTGLGARPIFNTDIFCFAYPSDSLPDSAKMLPAEAIMQGVRKGVQDGGNKSGIPTVNGAIHFHDGYRAKPLVYCGTGGLLPLRVAGIDGVKKHTKAGDVIVMAGGRVGKDGIHGATFSSESLHEGSPVTAVQIGDPFTQRRLTDFILAARDLGLITGITDNGAGGLSSSVGEMARITGGATLELDNIPLKYFGLADYEIVISESQERMTLSTDRYEELVELAAKYNVEATAVGQFHDLGYFEVTRQGKPVALLDLDFLHEGVPRLQLRATLADKRDLGSLPEYRLHNVADTLCKLLAHPNVCSRESVIRQYDHEVQGSSVVKPLMGPRQVAPCDAAVIRPILSQQSGLSIANGLCPQLSEFDCYLMAQCAVDEAVRNLVCVGTDPSTISLLDNFCWPDPVPSARNSDAEHKLAQLVRCCQGLFYTALEYQTPLISGKDSMKNDFDDGKLRLSIPPTLLISAIGRVPDADRCITMQFKQPGDLIYLIAGGTPGLAGSVLADVQKLSPSLLPTLDMTLARKMYESLHIEMQAGRVKSCHDLSEGGLAVAIAECIIGSGLGASIDPMSIRRGLINVPGELHNRIDLALFAEGPAQLLVTIAPQDEDNWKQLMAPYRCTKLGVVTKEPVFSLIDHFQISCDELTQSWQTEIPIND